MRTTIDAAGRLVVPKSVRDELGLGSGQELELKVSDGVLEISVPPTPMRVEERDGEVVVVAERPMPTLTVDEVRATLERVRR